MRRATLSALLAAVAIAAASCGSANQSPAAHSSSRLAPVAHQGATSAPPACEWQRCVLEARAAAERAGTH